MKRNLLLLAIPLFLLSCQKEFTPGELSGSGNNNGGTPSTACDTYFPITTGSTWTYDIDGSPQINTIITPDTLIQGKVFKRLAQKTSGSIVSSFFTEDKGNVFAFMDLGTNGIANGKVLLNLLRSNAAAGDQWIDTIVINGFTEKFEFTMVERNITHQVGALKFTNVHHVQYKVKIDSPPFFNDEVIQTTDAYFAKCVGPIESASQFSFSGINSTSSTLLKTYSVK